MNSTSIVFACVLLRFYVLFSFVFVSKCFSHLFFWFLLDSLAVWEHYLISTKCKVFQFCFFVFLALPSCGWSLHLKSADAHLWSGQQCVSCPWLGHPVLGLAGLLCPGSPWVLPYLGQAVLSITERRLKAPGHCCSLQWLLHCSELCFMNLCTITRCGDG